MVSAITSHSREVAKWRNRIRRLKGGWIPDLAEQVELIALMVRDFRLDDPALSAAIEEFSFALEVAVDAYLRRRAAKAKPGEPS